MVPSGSASAIHQFFRDRGLDIQTVTLTDMIEATLQFYETVPASGLAQLPQFARRLYQSQCSEN